MAADLLRRPTALSFADTSTAIERLSESAGRILGHLGGVVEFRRVQSTQDPRRGSESWSVVGEPVEARAHRFTATRKKQGGVRERYDRIAVERAPFEVLGGLSDEWEVLLDGWTPVENVTLSEDRTSWEADLCPVRAPEVSQ